MSVFLTVLVAASALLAQPAGSATCRTIGVEPQRTWRFARDGAQWQVAHWTGAADKDAVRVALPAAAVVRLSPTDVHVRARTSNGGIDVALTGTPDKATLDVYVSYELEVNVDTSLTPRIDELNTDGPVGVRCEVNGR